MSALPCKYPSLGHTCLGMTPAIPMTVDDFDIGYELGCGTYGHVLYAIDKKNGKCAFVSLDASYVVSRHG